jgi:hypothetical protein
MIIEKGKTYRSLYFAEIKIRVTSINRKSNTVYAEVIEGAFNVGKRFGYNLSTFEDYYQLAMKFCL